MIGSAIISTFTRPWPDRVGLNVEISGAASRTDLIRPFGSLIFSGWAGNVPIQIDPDGNVQIGSANSGFTITQLDGLTTSTSDKWQWWTETSITSGAVELTVNEVHYDYIRPDDAPVWILWGAAIAIVLDAIAVPFRIGTAAFVLARKI